jgi:hypothetical protein
VDVLIDGMYINVCMCIYVYVKEHEVYMCIQSNCIYKYSHVYMCIVLCTRYIYVYICTVTSSSIHMYVLLSIYICMAMYRKQSLV